jgi:integrase
VTVRESKTKAGRRDIPLSAELLAKLSPSPSEQLASRYVFPTSTGSEVDPHNFRKVFRAAAKRAGVPWATPHILRHTAGTLLAVLGTPPSEIGAYLGHADGGVLALRTYIHGNDSVDPEALARALAA